MNAAIGRLVWLLDDIAHIPAIRRFVPKPIRAWLCDRMDLSMGATRSEISRMREFR
jgi:hypothetical protein